MYSRVDRSAIAELRQRIARIEGGTKRTRGVLPFGVPAIDHKLPGGGLTLGSLHEIAGGGNDSVNGAAAALFAAGIAARTTGKVIWIITRRDLFMPAIAQAGLHPDRLIHIETSDEKNLLTCFEEALRHGCLGAAIAEIGKLDMTASRRLQLAAESSGATGLAIRRWRRQSDATDLGQPTASATRWRVSVLPSAPLPVPGIARPRWLLELIRCRAGESADFEVEACDAKGRIALPAQVANGSPQKEIGRRIAAE